MDGLVGLAWIGSLAPLLLFVVLVVFAIRAWGWKPLLWVLALALAGAAATALIQHTGVGWPFTAVSILAFPIGLLLPGTLAIMLFYHALWFGSALASVTLPLWYGIAFGLCAMFQVFVIFVIKERRDRHRRFRTRQVDVKRMLDETAASRSATERD